MEAVNQSACSRMWQQFGDEDDKQYHVKVYATEPPLSSSVEEE